MLKQITILTRAQWRNWLKKNHLKEQRVLLVSYKKHTGKKSISHREQIEEAICFGWIDTTVKRIDEDRFSRTFVKRKPKAGWSRNTLSYGARLFKAGKMSTFGKERYLEGKKSKPIDAEIPKNPMVPTELKQALAKNTKAKDGFAAYPPGVKKNHLKWLLSAKRPETRQKRIRQIVTAAAQGKRIW